MVDNIQFISMFLDELWSQWELDQDSKVIPWLYFISHYGNMQWEIKAFDVLCTWKNLELNEIIIQDSALNYNSCFASSQFLSYVLFSNPKCLSASSGLCSLTWVIFLLFRVCLDLVYICLFYFACYYLTSVNFLMLMSSYLWLLCVISSNHERRTLYPWTPHLATSQIWLRIMYIL